MPKVDFIKSTGATVEDIRQATCNVLIEGGEVKSFQGISFQNEGGNELYKAKSKFDINDVIQVVDREDEIGNIGNFSSVKQPKGSKGAQLWGTLASKVNSKNNSDLNMSSAPGHGKGQGGASTKKRRPRRGGRRLRQKSMKRNIKHRR